MNAITVTLGGAIELLLRPAPPLGKCMVSARVGSFTARGTDMAYTLATGNLVVVRVDYIDAQGHPAVVDGAVTWETSAPDIADVWVDPEDSHLCTITSGAVLGTAQITATADADLGDGVRELVTPLDVTVVAGEAVAGVISPIGDAQPIAPHVEPRSA